MQFNTALCLVLTGLGLLALSWRSAILARASAATLAAIAGLTLSQDFTGVVLGIDEALIQPFLVEAAAAPGRMSPNTSVGFLLASAFLALSTFPAHLLLPRSLLLVIGPAIIGLAALAITGYATGLDALFGWIPNTRMAVHTATGFLMFGIGASLKAWRLEAQRPQRRSYSIIAPVIVGALTIFSGIWLALRQYEADRVEALAGLYPDVSRTLVPEVAFGAGLVVTAIIGLTVHFAHAASEIRQLRAKNAELTAANAELDRFAHAASHDLKAPLRGVGLLVSWLRQELGPDIPAQAGVYFGQINDRITRLEDLLASLLAYAQINQSPRAPTRFQAASALGEIAALANLPPGMRVEIGPGSVEIRSDRALFDIVFINLISNAAKHHDRPEGRIDVTIREEEAIVSIEIADDGPGIAPRHHEKIFEMFQTLESRDDIEASGMGLALVQKALQRAGAGIELVSDPDRGRGSRFVVSWPKGVAYGQANQD